MTTPQTDAELIEQMIAAFNGGMVEKVNPKNPRGYTVYYRPREAMARVAEVVRLQALSTTLGDERATLAKIVSEHGNIMVSPMGEGLGWRPFGLEGWTAFPSEHPSSSVVKELVEALAKTQWMLEAIVHLRSTNFAEVQERILANRSALSRVQLPSVLMDNVDVKG